MQNPRFEDGFYKNYYEAYREIAFKMKNLQQNIEQQKERGSKVLKFLKNMKKDAFSRMLDHGCASGATMLSWKEQGWAVTELTPST